MLGFVPFCDRYFSLNGCTAIDLMRCGWCSLPMMESDCIWKPLDLIIEFTIVLPYI